MLPRRVGCTHNVFLLALFHFAFLYTSPSKEKKGCRAVPSPPCILLFAPAGWTQARLRHACCLRPYCRFLRVSAAFVLPLFQEDILRARRGAARFFRLRAAAARHAACSAAATRPALLRIGFEWRATRAVSAGKAGERGRFKHLPISQPCTMNSLLHLRISCSSSFRLCTHFARLYSPRAYPLFFSALPSLREHARAFLSERRRCDALHLALLLLAPADAA